MRHTLTLRQTAWICVSDELAFEAWARLAPAAAEAPVVPARAIASETKADDKIIRMGSLRSETASPGVKVTLGQGARKHIPTARVKLLFPISALMRRNRPVSARIGRLSQPAERRPCSA